MGCCLIRAMERWKGLLSPSAPWIGLKDPPIAQAPMEGSTCRAKSCCGKPCTVGT